MNWPKLYSRYPPISDAVSMFTDDAFQTLAAAEQLARVHLHAVVEPEHLLLALLTYDPKGSRNEIKSLLKETQKDAQVRLVRRRLDSMPMTDKTLSSYSPWLIRLIQKTQEVAETVLLQKNTINTAAFYGALLAMDELEVKTIFVETGMTAELFYADYNRIKF